MSTSERSSASSPPAVVAGTSSLQSIQVACGFRCNWSLLLACQDDAFESKQVWQQEVGVGLTESWAVSVPLLWCALAVVRRRGGGSLQVQRPARQTLEGLSGEGHQSEITRCGPLSRLSGSLQDLTTCSESVRAKCREMISLLQMEGFLVLLAGNTLGRVDSCSLHERLTELQSVQAGLQQSPWKAALSFFAPFRRTHPCTAAMPRQGQTCSSIQHGGAWQTCLERNLLTNKYATDERSKAALGAEEHALCAGSHGLPTPRQTCKLPAQRCPNKA